MRLCRNSLIRLMVVLVVISSLITPPAFCQETEDSQVFIAGFNAYQQKDYASTIEKMNEVLRKHPDTPLRDMALFWLSRAYYKTGNHQDAARLLSQFSKEYPDNPLKGTVEEELLSLTARYDKGEKLSVGAPPVKQPDKLAAQKAKAEKERIAAAKAEEAARAAAAAEASRVAALKQADEKAAAEKKERERLAAAKAEEERLAVERAVRDKAEQQRIAALKTEEAAKAKEKIERDRIAAAKADEAKQAAVATAEAARLASARSEEQRLAALEKKKAEDKLAAEKSEQQRLAQLKAEEERAAVARAEQQAEKSRAEQLRIAALKQEEERAASVKAEGLRLAAEKAAAEKKEQERLASAKAEEERLALERAAQLKIEQQRIAALKSEQEKKLAEEKLAADKAEQERLALVKAEAARAAAELAEKQRIAAIKAKEEREIAEKAEQERAAAVKAENLRLAAEKTAAEKKEQERIASAKAQKAEEERLANEKAAAEKAEKAEQQRIAAMKVREEREVAQKLEQERIAAVKAEEARLAAVAAESARIASLKAQKERKELEQAEQERLAGVKAEQERLSVARAEQERKFAAEKVEQERMTKAKAEEARLAAVAAESARMAALKAEEERKLAEKAANDAESARQASLKSEEQKLAQQRAVEEKIKSEKAALREKAIVQYKSIIDKYPSSAAAASAAAKLRELGVAVALPPKMAEVEKLPENAQILRLEVAQFAGFEFNFPTRPAAYNVAKRITIPFEIINRGNGDDSFYLESAFPPVFKANFATASSPDVVINQTPVMAPGETFKGIVSLTIPASSIDGLRIVHPVKAASRLMAEATQSREVNLTASAPLLRAVLKTDQTKPLPGEKVVYRIAILNVGSTVAQDVTFRLAFPPQLEPVDYTAAGFKQEMKSALVFNGLQVNSGESKEFSVTFQLKDDSLAGQELATRAELINNPLNTTAAFVSNLASVQPQRGILVRSGAERIVVIPGQTITVPFVVSNSGNVREKFKITSVVKGAQDAVIFHDINRDGIRQASEPVITEIGPLAPKEEANVVMEIKSPRSASDGAQGSVQVSFTSEGEAVRTVSGSAQLIYSRPVLQMLMAGRDGRLRPGEVASFDLTITNNGSNLARVVELQSAWPDQLELVAADPANSSVDNGNIIWRFKEMGAGEKRSIKVSFRVKPGTGVGTNIQVKNIMTYEDQLGNRY